ncbi:hypothetical protein WJX81_005228 [Elliptochloris bilobata]|uniref:Uncharacterized protein n=1 Tax=Elliptochloris bilobata TaxID=381761 RepID=A0AAW1RVP8_9CHLO
MELFNEKDERSAKLSDVVDRRVQELAFLVTPGGISQAIRAMLGPTALQQPQLAGTALRHATSRSRAAPRRCVTTAGVRKVNTYDESWKKGWSGTGYFVEDKESLGANLLKSAEQKKLLSAVEKSGLLSSAEKAGLTLSRIEKLGLLTKAEKFGLLSTLERLLTSDPAAISSLSIPAFVATLGALVLIPDDNPALAVAKYGVAALAGGVGVTFFAAGFLVAALQEEV